MPMRRIAGRRENGGLAFIRTGGVCSVISCTRICMSKSIELLVVNDNYKVANSL